MYLLLNALGARCGPELFCLSLREALAAPATYNWKFTVAFFTVSEPVPPDGREKTGEKKK